VGGSTDDNTRAPLDGRYQDQKLPQRRAYPAGNAPFRGQPRPARAREPTGVPHSVPEDSIADRCLQCDCSSV